MTRPLRWTAYAFLILLFSWPRVAAADGGLQPITVPLPAPTAVPGESRLRRREDGTYAAIPEVHGRTKVFHLDARPSPWGLQPSLVVMANTYNGVVPGPTLVVRQGDHVVIDYRNMLKIADTIHLHGIHGIPESMDGVMGISQQAVAPGGSFRYKFTAAEPGTFIYHTHGSRAMLDSGLYGAIIVEPLHPRPEEHADRDDVEMLSSWSIQSLEPNHFTINGREYPATAPIEVRSGDVARIRWINISSEDIHTMETHGHGQRIIARDAEPVVDRAVEDSVLLAPGQRVDVIINADQQPGNWLVQCQVLDHTEDAVGMPTGLITAIHYQGTPETLGDVGLAMGQVLIQAAGTAALATARAQPAPVAYLRFGAAAGLALVAVLLGIGLVRRRRA